MSPIFLAGTLPEPASGCPGFNVVPRTTAAVGHGEKAGAGWVCLQPGPPGHHLPRGAGRWVPRALLLSFTWELQPVHLPANWIAGKDCCLQAGGGCRWTANKTCDLPQHVGKSSCCYVLKAISLSVFQSFSLKSLQILPGTLNYFSQTVHKASANLQRYR